MKQITKIKQLWARMLDNKTAKEIFRFFLIVFAIILPFALYEIMYGIPVYKARQLIPNNPKAIKAVIYEYRYGPNGAPHSRYKFYYNNHEYKGDIQHGTREVGDSVEIYYWQDNPDINTWKKYYEGFYYHCFDAIFSFLHIEDW